MPGPWYLLTDADKYVYHYTTARTALQHILKDQTLKFGRFKSVNDPRESIDWSFAFDFRLDEIADTRELGRIANSLLKDNCNLCCFVTDTLEATQNSQTRNPLPSMYERGHSRPRMWAQYASDHTGVCLVFDKQKLGASFKKWAVERELRLESGRVYYGSSAELDPFKNRQVFTLPYADIVSTGIRNATWFHIQKHFHSLFFTKLNDWAQEREFRWLLMCNESSDKFLPISDSLIGVAIGERFSNVDRITLGKMLLDTDVDIAEMCWQNGFPQPSPLHPRPLSLGQNPPRAQ